jgi:RHS repeat-associated protein
MRYDGKTGLVDMNARWYDPNAGRFMSEDTYPGELNDPQSLNIYEQPGEHVESDRSYG